MSERVKKVAIFAGGRGTRLAEQTHKTPKPLIRIGNVPVIIHIMRHFYRQGYREFYIAVGYKSLDFKTYFRDYMMDNRTVVFEKNTMRIHECADSEDWVVHLVETGENSSTGQRIAMIKEYLNDEPFFLTYGDSVSNVDLSEVEKVHFSQSESNVATITSTTKGERFGILEVSGNDVTKFQEKAVESQQLINGGFILCNPSIYNYVNETTGDLSHETLHDLVNDDALSHYFHEGFWHAMDTQRDVDELGKILDESPELFGY